MTGEHESDQPDSSDVPLVNPPPTVVENAHTADPNLSPSEEFTSDTDPRSDNDGGTVKVSTRDIKRPAANAVDATGEGAFDDQLPRKDSTPVDPGGSSSLA